MFAQMKNYIERNEAQISGHIISVMYSSDNATRVSDRQILIPLDREIPPTGDFAFKLELNLHDCLMVKHRGNPLLMMYACDALLGKADELGYEIEHPIYYVITKEPDYENPDYLEVEAYAVMSK